MSIDQTQILQHKLYSKKTNSKHWMCHDTGYYYVLSDGVNHHLTKYCPTHKLQAIKDKNHRSYLRKVGTVRNINKREALLYLLKSKPTSSKYELLAYSTIKTMDSFRATITTLRSMGYKIYRKKLFYRLVIK